MKNLAVGIDIGGTNSEIGIVNQNGNVLISGKISTCDYDSPDKYVSDAAYIIKSLISKIEFEHKIVGVGIGAPNGNFYKGTIEFAPNLKWKGVIPLADIFAKALGFPAFLTNDANAAAIGEMIYGGAKDMKNFIIVTLGTGLGSGFVVDGKIVYGNDGFAGELGHTNVFPENGRLCGCGRKGCLETYASATGIVKTVIELLESSEEESELRSIKKEKITSKQIADAALDGDILAVEAFDYTARILGLKLADAVAITSPEAIFLFGGLAQSGKLIFEPVKKYTEQYLLNIFKNKVKILPSLLEGANAAILGASALVWNETV